MIKKFQLNKRGVTKINTTVRQLLSVDMQEGKLFLWLDSATDYATEYTFRVCYLNEDAPRNAIYVGTVQDGPFVYHVYYS